VAIMKLLIELYDAYTDDSLLILDGMMILIFYLLTLEARPKKYIEPVRIVEGGSFLGYPKFYCYCLFNRFSSSRVFCKKIWRAKAIHNTNKPRWAYFLGSFSNHLS